MCAPCFSSEVLDKHCGIQAVLICGQGSREYSQGFQPSKANSYFKCDNEMLEMIVCLDLVLCTGTGMTIYKISKEQQESVCVCVYVCN